MTNRKIKTYGLILLTMLIIAVAVSSVGETQAHYLNTTISNTIVEPDRSSVTSNLLTKTTDAPTTVLLADLTTQPRQIPLTLESPTDTSGKLTWSVDQPDYLTVQMVSGENQIAQDQNVEILKTAPAEINMVLTPTDAAFTTAHEEQIILITVSWGDVLTGKFQIKLPAVLEEDLPQTEPEAQTESTEETTDQTDPAEETETPVEDQPQPEETPLLTASLEGQVSLTGRALCEGEFAFSLYETSVDYGMTENAVPVMSAVNDAEGNFTFKDLGFTEAKEYYYYILQDTAAQLGGITYDTSRFLVCVDVEDVDGVLQANVIVNDNTMSQSMISYANTYAPKAASYTVSGVKTITGAVLKDDMFSFSLYHANESYEVQGEAIETVKNKADGSFCFQTIAYDVVGAYHYVIREDQSAQLDSTTQTGNIAFDQKVYGLTVTVADDGLGQLWATAALTVVSGEDADQIVFMNSYVPAEGEQPMIRLDTLSHFEKTGNLPVSVTLREEVTHYYIGLQERDMEEFSLVSFPAGTRYSLDQGNSYFLIYEPAVICLEPTEAQKTVIFMDYSNVALAAEEPLVLAAEAYASQSLLGQSVAQTAPDVQDISLMESRMLNRDAELKMQLPEGWQNCQLEYTAELLSVKDLSEDPETEQLSAEYIPVDLTAGGLTAEHLTEEEHALVFRIGEQLPPAGTYRIHIKWNYEGVCFAQTQTSIFINYTVYSDVDWTGGAEE